MLNITNLSKCYGDVTALNDVSFDIGESGVVAVIGRSGAGKSTLLRMINRLDKPSSGRIVFESEDILALTGAALRRWRASAAMVFQGYNLAPRLDVLTNVLVGASVDTSALRRLSGMHTEADRLRAAAHLDDLDLLDKALVRAERLSGGQQQRVAIARALMQRPRLILADEPVASLDPQNATIVMDTLVRIAHDRNLPVLCNLHSLELARRYAGRAIGLSSGRVVFDGPISTLTEAAVARIYGIQSSNDGAVRARQKPAPRAVEMAE